MPQLTEKRASHTPRELRLRREARSIPVYAPRSKGTGVYARAVGSYVPGLTRNVFEKYGFAAAALITDWTRIVGSELGSFTAPERLKWPQVRGAAAAGEPVEARPAATLILRVDAARALDAEYRARQIMERVNTYFGYRAVCEVKILQTFDLRSSAPAHHLADKARPSPAEALPGIADQGLAGALGRLKAGIDRRSGR